MNILVVDDEKEITDLIQIYLENENFIWIPTNHRLVKIKFHKHRLNGVHEAEPDTWISHLFYN